MQTITINEWSGSPKIQLYNAINIALNFRLVEIKFPVHSLLKITNLKLNNMVKEKQSDLDDLKILESNNFLLIQSDYKDEYINDILNNIFKI